MKIMALEILKKYQEKECVRVLFLKDYTLTPAIVPINVYRETYPRVALGNKRTVLLVDFRDTMFLL